MKKENPQERNERAHKNCSSLYSDCLYKKNMDETEKKTSQVEYEDKLYKIQRSPY